MTNSHNVEIHEPDETREVVRAFRGLARLENRKLHHPSLAIIMDVADTLPKILLPVPAETVSDMFVVTFGERLGLSGRALDDFHRNVCGANTELTTALIFAGRHGVSEEDVRAWRAGVRSGSGVATQHIREKLRGISTFVKPEVLDRLYEFVLTLREPDVAAGTVKLPHAGLRRKAHKPAVSPR